MSYGGTICTETAAVSCGQNRPLPYFFRALHSAFCAGHRLSSAESAGVAAYSDPAEKQGRCAADRVFQSASGGVCEAGCGSSHAGTDSSPYNRTACTGGRPFAYGIKKLFQRHLTEARSMRIRKSTGCSWHRSYYSKPIARLLKSPIGSGTKIRISFLLHFGKQPA